MIIRKKMLKKIVLEIFFFEFEEFPNFFFEKLEKLEFSKKKKIVVTEI